MIQLYLYDIYWYLETRLCEKLCMGLMLARVMIFEVITEKIDEINRKFRDFSK